MARRNGSGTFVLGIVLLVAGAALLAFGYYQYDQAQSSLATIGKKLIGKTSAAVTQSILMMVGGGIAALAGAFLAFFKRSR
jgi:uncharacterized membrane protein YidH (DUF202 family)